MAQCLWLLNGSFLRQMMRAGDIQQWHPGLQRGWRPSAHLLRPEDATALVFYLPSDQAGAPILSGSRL